ncbi:MAG TPA: hypothetical protein VMM85_01205 [Methylomirabilota bacterium]|nr:hypothetical protein [Methylomirabilota bacterium]
MSGCAVCGSLVGQSLDTLGSLIASVVASTVGVVAAAGLVAGRGSRALEGLAVGASRVAGRGLRTADAAGEAFWTSYDRARHGAPSPDSDLWVVPASTAAEQLGHSMGGQPGPPR